MFKVGDIVKVKTDKNNSSSMVLRTYISDTHQRELFVIKGLNSKYERHFLPESLEKDMVYYRKQKLKKICSKLEI